MGLNSFVAKEPRALPIVILADTSGSMSGEKINELNVALREMKIALNDMDDIRGKFQLSIISFGGIAKIEQPLEDIEKIALKELIATGKTPMSDAFNIVREMIEDKGIVSSRSYAPTIVLLSDGQPTDISSDIYYSNRFDQWIELQDLLASPRCAKSQRLALGIGMDANIDMLKAFINNPEIPVMRANDASGITKFFRWVTMSTVARMNSVNPDMPTTIAPVTFDITNEGVII